MPDLARSVLAGVGGAANITVSSEVPSGMVWVVSQIGVEVISVQTGVTSIVRKNGRFVTSTSSMPASASGAPYITLKAGDRLSVDYMGLVAGDTGIMSLFYNEIPWAQLANQQIDVV